MPALIRYAIESRNPSMQMKLNFCSHCGEAVETGIPEWDELAFPVVRETLRLYFQDRVAGGYPLRSGDILREPRQWRRYAITLLEDD